MWPHAHTCDATQIEAYSCTSARESITYTHCMNSQRLSDPFFFYSGGRSTLSTFQWPHLTEGLQLLLISRVTRRSRWASALGGTGRGGGGGGLELVIVNIFVPLHPLPVLYCVTLLRDPGSAGQLSLRWPCCYSAHCIF